MPKTLFERMSEAQSMTDDPKLQMARRICAKLARADVDRELFMAGGFDRLPEMRAALVAIEECTERAVKLAERTWPDGSTHSAGHIADSIRSFDHLKGPPQ